MREAPSETARAVGLALLLHVALFALMFAGLWWTDTSAPSAAAGSPISAELIDASDLSVAMQRTLADRPDPVPVPAPQPDPDPLPEPIPDEEVAAPMPQPLPEPVPEEAPTPPQPQVQQQLPVPDTVDQDAARRDAISRETAAREQEERRRQEQIDLTERERQAEAERRRRLSEMEQERQKQLADIRRRREAAAREAAAAEQRLEQIAERRAQQAAAQAAAAAPSPAPPGNSGTDTGLNARYAAALQEAILRNWTRPDNVPIGQRCRITIRQLPGGEVSSVEVSPSCPYDELGRRSVEAAVLRAQPLPYAGFESVFARQLNLNFEAQDR